MNSKLGLEPVVIDFVASRHCSWAIIFDFPTKVIVEFEANFIWGFVDSNIGRFMRFAKVKDCGQIILHLGQTY